MTTTTTDVETELRELRSEVEHLRAALAGDMPKALMYLQWKCWRQRRELDVLNRRVVSQRFVLRTLEELGRGLSRDEYVQARSQQPERLQERIDEMK